MDRKKNEIISVVRRFIKNSEDVVKIEKVILFGSRAKGTAKENSDIDIIISKDFENEKSYKRSPKFYLLWNYPYDVDIICLTPEEFEKKRRQIGVIRQAYEEGVEDTVNLSGYEF